MKSDNRICSQISSNFSSLVFAIICIGGGVGIFYIPWFYIPEGPGVSSIICVFSAFPFLFAWCICTCFADKFPSNSNLRCCIMSFFSILLIGSGLATFIVYCLTDGLADIFFGVVMTIVSLLPISCGWCLCYSLIRQRYTDAYLTKNDPLIAQKRDETNMQEYLSNYWQAQQVNTKN